VIHLVDRHILRTALARWLVVLAIGTLLLSLVEFLGKMGLYVRALGSELRWLVVWYYVLRLPEFLLTWLPLSVAVAALLVALPMLRQGTLMLLASAGLAPARAFVALLGLGTVASLGAFLLKDQILPRLDPRIDGIEHRLTTRLKGGRGADRPAGWRIGTAFWCAHDSFPAQGSYRNVAVIVDAPADGQPLRVAARRLEWIDGGWRFIDAVRIQGEENRLHATATPRELGVDLPLDRDRLAVALQPDSSKTGDQLWALGGAEGRRILLDRGLTACLPLLALLFALPGFVRWQNRDRLGAATVRAVLVALIPVAAVLIAGRLLAVSAANPPLVAVATAIPLFAIGTWRWARMRV